MKMLSLFIAITVVSLGAIAVVQDRAKPANDQLSFNVTGILLDLDRTENRARIRHDEIPGYMTTMTMPFHVLELPPEDTLRPGDPVIFRLVVTEDDSWIRDLARDPRRLPEPVELATPGRDVETEPLLAGERVPSFTLLDQEGRPFASDEFLGKALLVTFIYSRCPIPNYCPLMSKNFASLQERLTKEFPGRFHMISISIDPEFDRPEILKRYAERYTWDPATWSYATGSTDEIAAAAQLFGLKYQPENGLIAHDLKTALIGPDGRLVHIWKSNVWTPYEVQRRVREALTGRIDP